jgi:dipeptidase E
MLLTSNGLTNDTLVELLGKPIGESRVVVVLDGILGFPGDSTMLVEHLNGMRDLGWSQMDVASLFAGPRSLVESRLRAADVILGYGGSNLWAAHAWAASGLSGVLAQLLDEKVYVGWSAGSMIFSRGLDRWAEAFDDQEEVDLFELDDVSAAVPLFDWYFIGHLDAEWMPDDAEAWAARGALRTGRPVWLLDDASALLIRDPDTEPSVVSAGRWARYGADGTPIGTH